MEALIKKRIEEAAEKIVCSVQCAYFDLDKTCNCYAKKFCIKTAEEVLRNQWISVDEALPTENRIIARLSESFCGTKDCIEVLHFCERYGLTSPEGYYDLCGEEVPTNAITHWMPIPQLKGG